MSRVIGVASTIVSAAAGISSRQIWRMPVPIERAQAVEVAARGEAG